MWYIVSTLHHWNLPLTLKHHLQYRMCKPNSRPVGILQSSVTIAVINVVFSYVRTVALQWHYTRFTRTRSAGAIITNYLVSVIHITLCLDMENGACSRICIFLVVLCVRIERASCNYILCCFCLFSPATCNYSIFQRILLIIVIIIIANFNNNNNNIIAQNKSKTQSWRYYYKHHNIYTTY